VLGNGAGGHFVRPVVEWSVVAILDERMAVVEEKLNMAAADAERNEPREHVAVINAKLGDSYSSSFIITYPHLPSSLPLSSLVSSIQTKRHDTGRYLPRRGRGVGRIMMHRRCRRPWHRKVQQHGV
jgi:hypothetical protein